MAAIRTVGVDIASILPKPKGPSSRCVRVCVCGCVWVCAPCNGPAVLPPLCILPFFSLARYVRTDPAGARPAVPRARASMGRPKQCV